VKCKVSHGKNEEKGEFENLWSESLKLNVIPQSSLDSMVKSWLDDPRHNCKPNANVKDYLKEEYSLVEDNYDLLEEVHFFEQLQVDND
jgi:hypothetical protein